MQDSIPQYSATQQPYVPEGQPVQVPLTADSTTQRPYASEVVPGAVTPSSEGLAPDIPGIVPPIQDAQPTASNEQVANSQTAWGGNQAADLPSPDALLNTASITSDLQSALNQTPPPPVYTENPSSIQSQPTLQTSDKIPQNEDASSLSSTPVSPDSENSTTPKPDEAPKVPNLTSLEKQLTESWKNLSPTDIALKFNELLTNLKSEGKTLNSATEEAITRALTGALLVKTGFRLESDLEKKWD